MAKKPTSTKNRLIKAAAYLIHRRGYHDVGLNDILKLAKAPKGVLYHHFPGGKPALGEAAIDYAAIVFNDQMNEAVSNITNVSEFIIALGKLTAGDLVTTKFKAGCPLTTVALETAPYDKNLSEACRRGFDIWLTTLTQYLEKFDIQRPQATAELILSALEGALAIARTRKDTAIVTQTAQMLAHQMHR